MKSPSSRPYFLGLLGLILLPSAARSDEAPGEPLIQAYFRQQTAEIETSTLADIKTLEDWEAKRPLLRAQLLDMLGLDPLPERTPLHPVITAVTDHSEFRVERLHFQSRAGLYVTANFYIPRGDGPFPTILYGCGHARVAKDGVSFGNKAHYHHHGSWFARHGFVCLTIDSLQLGEIEAIHHGTYRYDMWWWLNRGYTPAGVEAWNCVRALDYLETRPEVDPARLGVTGRSGGGIYSWWISAIDDRIKVAVPVAGITDLRNQVIDGCVEGHCDCMFHVNTYRWDFPTIAALVAPRPLLISNSDRDSIFPLDGVVRTHAKVKAIYELYGKPENLALQITAGPHQDTQELRIHAFRWFNHFLRETDALIKEPAVSLFEPEQLQVFGSPAEIPQDEINTTIHESFVPVAEGPAPPAATETTEWAAQLHSIRGQLSQKTFAGWPRQAPATRLLRHGSTAQHGEIRVQRYQYHSQDPFRLDLVLIQTERAVVDAGPKSIVVRVLDADDWSAAAAGLRHAAPVLARGLQLPAADASAAAPADAARWNQLVASLPNADSALALVLPRGIGPTQWDPSPRKQLHYRRRFHLLGQTLDGMRVWDVRRALQAIRNTPDFADLPVTLEGQGIMAGVALYASLFEPPVARLNLRQLPSSHREGPYLLNIRRTWDLPQAERWAQAHCDQGARRSDAAATTIGD